MSEEEGVGWALVLLIVLALVAIILAGAIAMRMEGEPRAVTVEENGA